MTICTCLYCEKVTGRVPTLEESTRKTICQGCVWNADRDERREVEAGLRPWIRPLSFWANRQGAMPDEEAARYQVQWDAEQARIRRHNMERWYAEGTPQHAEVIEYIRKRGL